MHFVAWKGGGFCIVGVGREGANIRGIALLCPSGLAWLGDAGYWMGVDEMGLRNWIVESLTSAGKNGRMLYLFL
jgi:hypothetical protein